MEEVTKMSNVKAKKSGIWKTIISSFSLLKKAGSGKYIIISLLGLISSISLSVLALINKYFINSIENTIQSSSPIYSIYFWVLIYFIIEFIWNLTEHFYNAGINHTKLKCKFYVLEKLLNKSLKIKVKYFDDYETYNKFKLTMDNLAIKISDIITNLIKLIYNLLNFISLFIVISSINLKIVLILLLGIVPSIIITKSSFIQEYYQALWNLKDYRKAFYLYSVLINRNHQKDIRFGNYYSYLLEKYKEKIISVHKKNMAILKKFILLRILGSTFSYFSAAVAMFLVIKLILNGQANIGSFVLLYSSMFVLQNVFLSMFSSISVISQSGFYIDHYDDIMHLEEEEKGIFVSIWNNYKDVDIYDNYQEDTLESGDIKVDNVYFTYPNTNHQVLSGLSCTIKNGEKIAIIGENGCGKSTFVYLLLGLLEPDSGMIYYDNIPLNQQIKKVRSSISCILQNFGQYYMTIKENIMLGDITRKVSPGEINTVCDKLKIKDYFNKFKKGLDTYVGNLEEHGVFLSGGEWQKVALAGALIKKNAKILILDEPTAALDPISESKLYQEFDKLSGNRTTIFISHRLAVTRIVDRILVFHEGKIIEDGNHEQLMKNKGKYYKMYTAQSIWYEQEIWSKL